MLAFDEGGNPCPVRHRGPFDTIDGALTAARVSKLRDWDREQ